MLHISDLLNRFRPVGPPGSASRAGIPADRAAQLAAELDPVLSMLAATRAQCAALVGEAERRAVQLRGDANAQAAAIAAESADRVVAASVAAADTVIAAAHAESARIEQAAVQHVRARPELTEAEVQALVGLAVSVVKSAPGG